jgi:hypothetical protein
MVVGGACAEACVRGGHGTVSLSERLNFFLVPIKEEKVTLTFGRIDQFYFLLARTASPSREDGSCIYAQIRLAK